MMYDYMLRLALALGLCFSPSILFAASKNSVLSDCNQAMELGDMEAAQTAADIIFSWRDLFSDELKIKGAECLTFARGGEHVYDVNLGLFVTGAAVEKALDAETARALMRQLTKAEARLERALLQVEELNNDLINNEVHATCISEYAKSPTLVILNSECVLAFRKSGHPDLGNVLQEESDYAEALKSYNDLFQRTTGLRD